MSPRTRRFALGSLLAVALAMAGTATAAGPAKATLNLKDVDIGVLIQAVSETTGRNFVVDPKVTGKVTVVATAPMSNDEIWNVFVSALAVNGYAVVPDAGAWKVVPESVAATDGRAAMAGGAEAIVTRVVELHDVPAAELSAILQRLVSPNGRISAQGNRLMITERAANADRLLRLVARIDTPSNDEVEVIALEHANALDIARTLAQLEPSGAAVPGGARLVADPRSNSVLLSGNPGQRLRLRALVAHFDLPANAGGYAQVIPLHNTQAAELAPLLEPMLAAMAGGGGNDGAGHPAAIGFHAATNSLVVTAPPAVFRDIAAVVRELDARRPQVMVEAVIAEVTDELADEIGIQWQATSRADDADGAIGRGAIGGTNFPARGGVGGILGAMLNPLGLGTGLNLGYADGTVRIPGPGGNPVEVLRIGALVHALRGDGRANILSQPSVLTLDNAPAEFKVAQEVPFLTGAYATTQAAGSGGAGAIPAPFQTIERRDVGLILKVTPHVDDTGGVRMEIVQEASSLAPSQSAGAVDLITSKRQISTTVQVADGSLLVLGGLSSDEVSESVQGIPGLSRIPLLGQLFKSRQSNRSKRNLLIFLRPVVLRDAAAAASLSGDRYDLFRQRHPFDEARYDRVPRGGDVPALPALPALPAPPAQGAPAKASP